MQASALRRFFLPNQPDWSAASAAPWMATSRSIAPGSAIPDQLGDVDEIMASWSAIVQLRSAAHR